MKRYKGFQTKVNLMGNNSDGNMGALIDLIRQVMPPPPPPPPPPPTYVAPVVAPAPVYEPPPVIQVPPSIPTGYFDEPIVWPTGAINGAGPTQQPPTGGSGIPDDMGPLDLGVEFGGRPFDPNDPFAPVSIGPFRGSGPAGALFPGSGQEIDAPILDANGKPIQSTAFPTGGKGAKVPLTTKQKQNLGIAAAVALFVLFGA